MGYKCKSFRIEELVCKATFQQFGERCWEFLNPKMLVTLDQFHDEFGKILINTWLFDGPLQSCGLRDKNIDASGGAAFSIHKLGGADDCHPQQVTPQEMHARILAKPDRFNFVTCLEAIESTPGWVHADVRNHQQDSQIIVAKP